MGPHTTSDDPTRYRSDDEVAVWAARDPIARYRTYLQSVGVLTERLEERIRARSKRLRAELREAVVGAGDFDVADMFDTVYHDITPELVAQREQLRAELAREEQDDSDHRKTGVPRRG
jgi:2-oxoisovalerate dehydrogenase E1 component alpha subunit